jgi:hypothetical protein
MILSEARAIKRAKAKRREVTSFVKASPPAISNHETFLQAQAVYIFVSKRLFILEQHEERNRDEIQRLRKIRGDVLKENPSCSDGLTEEDLVGTIHEL